MAAAVGSTFSLSPLRLPRRAIPGATRFNSGQHHSMPKLPASVLPPDHARPRTGQDTGQSRSTKLELASESFIPHYQ